jgi:hypothetical protein
MYTIVDDKKIFVSKTNQRNAQGDALWVSSDHHIACGEPDEDGEVWYFGYVNSHGVCLRPVCGAWIGVTRGTERVMKKAIEERR